MGKVEKKAFASCEGASRIILKDYTYSIKVSKAEGKQLQKLVQM